MAKDLDEHRSSELQDGDVDFDYDEKYDRKKPSAAIIVGGNCAKIRIRAVKSSREFENRIDESGTFEGGYKCESSLRDQRLNGILQICLEPRNPGDLLSSVCRKNFVVQYFTVSRNQPVKLCCRSHCPLTKQDPRMKDSGQQPRTRGRLKKFEEIHGFSTDSEGCDSFAGVDNSLRGEVKEVNDRRAACSKISGNESQGTRKRHAPNEQMDSEQTWHARCSNFIVNLPVTLSGKLFGPARINAATIASKELKDDDHGVSSEDYFAPLDCRHRRPVSKEPFEEEVKKTSDNSTADCCSCHKDVATETRILIENGNRVKTSHSRTSRFLQEERKSCVTRRKTIPTCVNKTLEDSFTEFEFPDPLHQTRCFGRIKMLEKTPAPGFLNWPTVVSERFFRSRRSDPRKASMRRSVARKKRPARGRDAVIDDREIDPKGETRCAVKKGRLMLKKYTISQSPEATEETLCFDVLGAEEEEEEREEIAKTRSKLRSQIRVEIGNGCAEIKRNLKAIEGTDINASRKTLGKMMSKSNRERDGEKFNSKRGRRKVEKNTSTGQIFLSNLIVKLLKGGGKGHRDGKKIEGGCTARNHCEDKPGASRKIMSRNVVRKYASTGIKKNRNNGMKRPRNAATDSPKGQDKCCAVDSRNCLRANEARRKTLRDYSSGRKTRASESESGASCSRSSSGRDIENSKNVCQKKTRVMTRVKRTRAKANGEECRICKRCGSSRGEILAKSGILQSIDAKNNCETRSSCSKMKEEEIRNESLENLETPRSTQKAMTCRRDENVSASGLRTCERLIVKANEISDPVNNRTSEFSAEGLRRTFVVAGENIRVKMLYDRHTSTELLTDEFPESVHRRSSKSSENGRETASRGVVDGVEDRNPDSKSASSSAEERHSVCRNRGNEPEKAAAKISQGLAECDEIQGQENNASKVNPEGISSGNEGGVISSLVREIREERERTVCVRETCLYNKTLIESGSIGEEESEPRDINTGNNPGREAEEDGEEEAAENKDEVEKKGEEIFEHGSERETYHAREDLRLPKLQPCETERGKVRAADGFDVKKVKSRNTINAYYSREKRDAYALSRRDGTTNDKRYKGEKISKERGKSYASDKGVAKVRHKLNQQIVNQEQVARGFVNSVTVKNRANESDNQGIDDVEKEEEIFHDEAKDGTSNDSTAPLPSGSSFASSQAIIGGVSVVRRSDEMQYPVERLETDTPAAKTGSGKKRCETEERTKRKPWYSAGKAVKSSNTKLEEDFRKSSGLRKGNSGRAISKRGIKDGGKEIPGKNTTAMNARSESSNRFQWSVDIQEAKGAGGGKKFAVENANKAGLGSQKSGKNEKERKENISKLGGRIGTAIRKSTLDSDKKIGENIRSKSKESRSERADNKKSEESAPSRLSPQINSETETKSPETTSADLCSSGQIDGRNNVESYNDLQSSTGENCYSNRISAPKDDVSRGLTVATVLRSEPDVLKGQKIAEITAKNCNIIVKKPTNFEAKTPQNKGQKRNSVKRTESGLSRSKKHNSTESSSSSNDNADSGTRGSALVDNNRICGINGRAESPAKSNSKEDEHLAARRASASDNESERKTVVPTDCSNLNKNCTTRATGGKFLTKNTSPIKTVKKTSPDSRIPYRCAKTETAGFDPRDVRSRREARSKAQEESGSAKTASDSADVTASAKVIECVRKSVDPESAETGDENSNNKLCFANEEKEIAQHEYDDASERASFSTSKSRNGGTGRNRDSLERDFSFTDDLKRFLDQGQEFFTFKRRRVFQRKNPCFDGERKTTKFESESCRVKTAEADGREVKKSSETCDDDRAKHNSMSSLERTFNTLKTILGKRKSGHKSSTKGEKRTKETQICRSAKDCQVSCKSEKSVESKTLNSNESLSVSISFGSSIFSHRNLPNCKEQNKNCN